MLRHVLSWWAAQLLSLLPAGRDELPTALVARPAPDGVALALRRSGRERSLGRFADDAAGLSALRRALPARRRGPTVLRTPAELLLEREVVLPDAAGRDLGNALRHGLDGLTPFAADDVFWGWRVVGREAAGRLRVRLSLLPRRSLAAAIAQLDRAGLPVRRLEATAPDGGTRVLAAGADPVQRRSAGVTAAALCAGLAIVAAALPFGLLALRASRVEARIAALRPRVEQVEALRRRAEAGTAGADVLSRERARTGDALAAIAAVTAVLPDDTWLSELALGSRKLLLTGQSAAAARLIPAMAADPALRAPAFAAPVTRAPNGQGDQFTIQVELAPTAEPGR